MNTRKEDTGIESQERGLDVPKIEGEFFGVDGKRYLDRRYTAEYVEQSTVLTPRTADLNIVGPAIVELSTPATRASVKKALLNKNLPGVNL